MAIMGGIGTRNGTTAGLLLAGAVGLLALPSAVLAFSTRFKPAAARIPANPAMQPLNGIAAHNRLAQAAPVRSLAKGPLFLFTPAGMPNRPDRSVTVAVRVDPQAAQIISVRGIRGPQVADAGTAAPGIAPTAFNLGVSRGYQTFAQSLVSPADSRKAEMPDLSGFSIAPDRGGAPPRFSPHIALDEKQAAGRAPRTFAGDSDEQVDVGGSYRLTRNLNVTAGLRYSSQDRERLHPLTDGKQDNQAVYLGTQFRF